MPKLTRPTSSTSNILNVYNQRSRRLSKQIMKMISTKSYRKQQRDSPTLKKIVWKKRMSHL